MTPEERIAQLEAELRELRAVVATQAAALADAMAERRKTAEARDTLEARRAADRERQRQSRLLRKVAREQTVSRDHVQVPSRDCHVTPPSSPSPFPSSFPPSPGTSSPYPLSFPPSSSPPVSPASQAALLEVAERPQKPAKARKPKPEKQPVDPRHAPLVKALVEDLGFPWDSTASPLMAASVKALLARADGRPETAGAMAIAEVVRRGRIALAQTGYYSARSLPEFRKAWDRLGEPQQPMFGTGPPRATDGIGAAPPASTCGACGQEAETARVGEPGVRLCYKMCLPAWHDANLPYQQAMEWAERRKRAG